VGEFDAAVVVGEALDGIADAWDQLVDRYSGLVWAVARGEGLGPTDAADVCQTAWLRLAEHLGRLRSPESVGAWLATTARHEAQRVLRRHQYQTRLAPTRSVAWQVDAEEEVLDAEDVAELWQAFEELPPPCRTLLRMLIADPPPSYAEVSEILEMPIGSIGPRRARCLARLRTRLAMLGEDPSSAKAGARGE
jgi:RNA polymerase sigma factor (sigma-70 family)